MDVINVSDVDVDVIDVEMDDMDVLDTCEMSKSKRQKVMLLPTLTREELDLLHKRKARRKEAGIEQSTIILDGGYYEHLLPYLRTMDHNMLHVAWTGKLWKDVEKTEYEDNAVKFAGQGPKKYEPYWGLEYPHNIRFSKDGRPPLAHTVRDTITCDDFGNRITNRQKDHIYKEYRIFDDRAGVGMHGQPLYTGVDMIRVALSMPSLSSVQLRFEKSDCCGQRSICDCRVSKLQVYKQIRRACIPQISCWALNNQFSANSMLLANPNCTHISIVTTPWICSDTGMHLIQSVHGDIPHVHIHSNRKGLPNGHLNIVFGSNTIDTLLITSSEGVHRLRDKISFDTECPTDDRAVNDHLRRVIVMYNDDVVDDELDMELYGIDTMTGVDVLYDKDVWIHKHKRIPYSEYRARPNENRTTIPHVNSKNPDWVYISTNDNELDWFPVTGVLTRLWHKPPGTTQYTPSDNYLPIMRELVSYHHCRLHNFYWNDVNDVKEPK